MSTNTDIKFVECETSHVTLKMLNGKTPKKIWTHAKHVTFSYSLEQFSRFQ